MIGWIMVFTETVSASTVALGFAGYIKGIFESIDLSSLAIFLGVVAQKIIAGKKKAAQAAEK
ncbi:MAG: hypothetical protein OEZ24_01285 [Candidatus Bathyarchaeota archaeon]|nr:hypothetical protein [Candidatus Bathyarchaeota archaeon]